MDRDGKTVLRWFGPDRPEDKKVREAEKDAKSSLRHSFSLLSASSRLPRGKLPSRAEFDVAFDLEVPGGLYSVRGPRGEVAYPVPDGEYSCSELWSVLRKLVRSGSLYVAGSILQTLGFEWS